MVERMNPHRISDCGELPMSYPEVGLDAVLAGAAASYGDRVGLADGTRELTFTDIHDRAIRVASGLRARGIGNGDHVAIAMPNNLWFPVVYLGTVLAGATACTVNPVAPTQAIEEQFEEVDPAGLFVHPLSGPEPLAARTPSIGLTVRVPGEPSVDDKEVEVAHSNEMISLAELMSDDPVPLPRCRPEWIAHLQFTGGTTGKSKAVRITHRNILANMIQLAACRSGTVAGLDEHGRVRLRLHTGAQHRYSDLPGTGVALHIAPNFHGAGLNGLLGNIFTGTTTVLMGRFEPEAYAEAITRHQVTKVGGVPSMFHSIVNLPRLHEHDFRSVLTISFGAAPTDTTTLQRIHDVFSNARVCEGYGLSEATCYLTMQPMHPDCPSPMGSVGVPLPDTGIDIRDPHTAEPLPEGRIGEIWAQGPQVTDGYHRAAEQTEEQFVDGWLRTGDLGHIDADGNLFIDGRAKDMLIYKGYNIYPVHLEEILSAHPAVDECAVVGVESPGVGQLPVAFVIRAAGYAQDTGLADELAGFVAARVAPHQRIREVRFVTAFPMSPVGKILKRTLASSAGPPA
ncbi:class I adenylate-forming enzyme family protein [Rhodococcus artemisiae]|uniref:Class I adenylate-forming enzyme family protein n=1 Tax=Rhodococcus artemisiae TaxID=714159 RepID=A0ABU7LB87_9NOCA|nr:class I adenylate-forming enzyme family protein [Rhodococcus artemisiae]MEE2058803.1 class I adenylate-forming enzyme family protein [Rhodococcus artemisiae]